MLISIYNVFFSSKSKELSMPSIKMPKMPEVHIPKVDMKAKMQDMNESIKKAKMPKPQEIKDGYLNSNFHKSFHQQLAVHSRVVEPEELQQVREHMMKRKTPAELAQINHPSEIPIPTFKLSAPSKPKPESSTKEDTKSEGAETEAINNDENTNKISKKGKDAKNGK